MEFLGKMLIIIGVVLGIGCFFVIECMCWGVLIVIVDIDYDGVCVI